MSPSNAEVGEVLELATRLAHGAGEIQRSCYEKSFAVRVKGTRRDLVTEVDHKCEAFIVEGIEAQRPADAILAEEGGGADRDDAEWRWVVDPLDGTTNYAHGFPRFCVSIGVEHREERRVAVVYDPLLDELYHATRGGGAWLGERKLSVSSEIRLDRSLACTGFAYDVDKSLDDNVANFSRMIKSTGAVRRDGSAALDLCYVAAGRFDAFWEFKLQAWDIAAGLLLVEEAGGRCSDARGGPVPRSGEATVATNGHLHSDVLQLLDAAGQTPARAADETA